MSKTAEKLGNLALDLSMSIFGKRQKNKARARVASRIFRDYEVISTKNGDIKVYSGRGPFIASIVQNWEKDEPETRYWLENHIKDGDVLWDVGANIGAYAIYATKCAKNVKVVAFEPSGMNLGLLTEHVTLNECADNIDIYPIALSAETGLMPLYIRSLEQGAACNSVGESAHQFGAFDASLKHMAMCFTADEFIKKFDVPAPTHIKIDVDGIEKYILRGAKKTLKTVKSMIIELEGKNENDPEIEKMIKDAGLTESDEINDITSGRNRLFVRA